MLADSAPVDSLPEAGFTPLHEPLARHSAAPLADHVSVALAPFCTVAGAIESDTVGPVAPTATLTERVVVPPAPLHASV